MTDAHLSDLLARVKAASGPDREIDAMLYSLFAGDKLYSPAEVPGYGGRFSDDWCVTNGRYNDPLPRYTSDLNAALSLVEKMLPGSDFTIFKIDGEYGADIGPTGTFQAESAKAKPTPALALLSALLAALSALEARDGG